MDSFFVIENYIAIVAVLTVAILALMVFIFVLMVRELQNSNLRFARRLARRRRRADRVSAAR